MVWNYRLTSYVICVLVAIFVKLMLANVAGQYSIDMVEYFDSLCESYLLFNYGGSLNLFDFIHL